MRIVGLQFDPWQFHLLTVNEHKNYSNNPNKKVFTLTKLKQACHKLKLSNLNNLNNLNNNFTKLATSITLYNSSTES